MDIEKKKKKKSKRASFSTFSDLGRLLQSGVFLNEHKKMNEWKKKNNIPESIISPVSDGIK